MTNISPISPISFNDNKSVYNAVKIKIDSPSADIPADFDGLGDNVEFNAVNLEVSKPSLNVYSYPDCVDCITSDKYAGYIPSGGAAFIQLPPPNAYQTNLINNRTFINAEFEVRDNKNKKSADMAVVPEPNFTTVEDEKNISFNGLSFKAAPKVEVAPDGGLTSTVDIGRVRDILKSNDFDVQAVELEKIATAALDKDYSKVTPYLTSEIFSALGDIIEKDTSSFEKPDEAQIEARQKIILNEIAKAQALSQNPNMKPEDIKLPFEITDSDKANAARLSQFEMAERNKEYGIYTLAGLIRVYTEEFQKNMGDVVPMTDLPCISAIVNTLKSSDNPDLKIAAINALMIIKKPEYSEEIGTILKVASNNPDQYIAQYAAMAADSLKK